MRELNLKHNRIRVIPENIGAQLELDYLNLKNNSICEIPKKFAREFIGIINLCDNYIHSNEFEQNERATYLI